MEKDEYVIELSHMKGKFFHNSFGSALSFVDKVCGFVHKRYVEGQHLCYKNGELVARIVKMVSPG